MTTETQCIGNNENSKADNNDNSEANNFLLSDQHHLPLLVVYKSLDIGIVGLPDIITHWRFLPSF